VDGEPVDGEELVLPSAVAPSAVVPSAVVPSAVAPSAVVPSAVARAPSEGDGIAQADALGATVAVPIGEAGVRTGASLGRSKDTAVPPTTVPTMNGPSQPSFPAPRGS
jgi:hypothetical protein